MQQQKLKPLWTTQILAFVLVTLALLQFSAVAAQDDVITWPFVAEDVSPIEIVQPVAQDGYQGLALVRKPPGDGPFPAVVLIHGGLSISSIERLTDYVLERPFASRFLSAGYVVANITYRSRNIDPQSQVSRDDSMAAVDYLQSLSYVDASSIGIYGCSGGGDLALSVAAEKNVAAIIAEEPASVMFTGIWDDTWPKAGDRYTPRDSLPAFGAPLKNFTKESQRITREKIARIQSPILIIQGDAEAAIDVNGFNSAVLIPELRAAGKELDVITYPGEPHCFAFGSRAGSERGALKAFQDTERFLRQNIKTMPEALNPSLLELVPISFQ